MQITDPQPAQEEDYIKNESNVWRCGDNVLTIISTYLIFMQLQSQSWQILNIESYSFCPLIFLTLNWDCQIIYKKWLWEKHFFWPINDKCFFLRKWSHFFLAFVYFQCLVFFLLCYILITLESAGLSVFHSLVVLFSGAAAAAVMCFLSQEIYRHISLLDRHNEPQGSPKEKQPRAVVRFSLSLHLTFPLTP